VNFEMQPWQLGEVASFNESHRGGVRCWWTIILVPG